jgi:hypothetical protein
MNISVENNFSRHMREAVNNRCCRYNDSPAITSSGVW